MWKIAVFACLLVVCAAQTRPNISEVFDSHGNVEIHRGTTAMGKFRVAWNPPTRQGMEQLNTTNAGVAEDFETLYRLDKGEVDYLRSDGSQQSCQVEKESGNLPLFWGWLKDAKYIGNETLKHVVYDQWQYDAAGVKFEVLVGKNNPNIPFQYVLTQSHAQVKYEFLKFSATTPPSDAFKVPKACT